MRYFIDNNRSAGPVIQSKPEACPFCDGRQIMKRGLRKNTYRKLQLYRCGDCGRCFAPLQGLKGVKYHPRVIARALCLYSLGNSQPQTARHIESEHRIAVPRRTLSDWITRFRPITTFHRLRRAAIAEFSQKMLKARTLEHQQIYQYKVHLAKLGLALDGLPPQVASKVRTYLLSVYEDFPDALFRRGDISNHEHLGEGDGQLQQRIIVRSSKSKFQVLPLFPIAKQNLANDLAAMGLLLARRNKDRHSSVQDFMLANDSCTIACEVPVYLSAEEIRYYKAEGFFVDLPDSGEPITGHIDLVQVRNGLIHLLDYKPKASHTDPVNQLVLYALAFASRTRLPLKLLKCAWFDEIDYFEFYPLEAVKPRTGLDACSSSPGRS